MLNLAATNFKMSVSQMLFFSEFCTQNVRVRIINGCVLFTDNYCMFSLPNNFSNNHCCYAPRKLTNVILTHTSIKISQYNGTYFVFTSVYLPVGMQLMRGFKYEMF